MLFLNAETLTLLLIGTSEIIQVQATCLDGWKGYESSCYIMLDEAVRYQQANEMCEKLRGHLVVIEDAAEDDFLRRMARGRGFKSLIFWLGGNDSDWEGKWVWSWNGQRLTYKNFALGQPDNKYNREDCLAMPMEYGYNWADASCYTFAYPICEMSQALLRTG